MSWAKVASLITVVISGLVFSHARVSAEEDSAPNLLPVGYRRQAVAGFPDYRELRRKEFLSQVACGPVSLITILRSLGVFLTPDDTEQIIAAAGSEGMDLGQLKALAESRGVYALGVEVSPEKLKKVGLHAIVHLHDVSFAAVTGYSPGGLLLVYPMKKPVLITDASFKRAFGKTGRALLLSTAPLYAERLGLAPPSQRRAYHKGPVLTFSKGMISVGRIHGHDWESTIALQNDGTETLHIKGVKSSCSCITAALDQENLEPKRSTLLRVKGHQASVGGFRYNVVLLTNQKQTAAVNLPVRGFVEPPAFFDRPALTLEKIVQDRAAQIEVPLVLADRVDIGSVRAVVPEAAPLEAKAGQTPDGEPVLEIRWGGASTPGWYQYPIDVVNDDWPDSAKSTLGFAVQVIPLVDIFPPSLFIHDSEIPNQWSRRVTLRFNGDVDDQFELAWTKPTFAQAIRVVRQTRVDHALSMLLLPESSSTIPGLSGQWADLTFRFPNGYESTLRFYVGNNSFLTSGVDNKDK